VDTPVLIVGGGPIGLALAGELGWRGVACTLIERGDGSIGQPRMDFVGVRTMEFCRRWGIVGDVEAAPYPRDYPQDNIYMAGSLAEGWEIGRYEVPTLNAAKAPPQSPQRRERCPQNMFDPVLRRHAERYPTVELRYRHRFVRYEQTNGGVAAEIEDVAAGRTYTVDARWLVGCDGGSSAVRTQMGVAMLGNPALTYTTNVIFRCAGFERLHPIRPGYRFILVGPEGTWATIVAINGRDQWRFSIIKSGDSFGAPDEAQVHAAIRRAVGREFDYEILSIVPWTRRELVAERMHDGNVFIAGDAAHVTSPTGGFGMNMGVGDAVDLSWKMTAVLEGWGGPRLLDSYTPERRPVAERNVREASENLARMLSPPAHPNLLDRTDEAAKLRTQVGKDLAQAMMREWNTLGMHLGYRYDASPVIWPDGSPTPPMPPDTYEQTARPGARAPHVWLQDGRSTLDLFGRGFTLLCLGQDAPDAGPLEAAAKRVSMPLAVHRLAEPDVREVYAAPLVLVRPDGHVAWRGAAFPDPARLIDCVRGG